MAGYRPKVMDLFSEAERARITQVAAKQGASVRIAADISTPITAAYCRVRLREWGLDELAARIEPENYKPYAA